MYASEIKYQKMFLRRSLAHLGYFFMSVHLGLLSPKAGYAAALCQKAPFFKGLILNCIKHFLPAESIYVALSDFEGDLPDELSVKKGDKMSIIDDV